MYIYVNLPESHYQPSFVQWVRDVAVTAQHPNLLTWLKATGDKSQSEGRSWIVCLGEDILLFLVRYLGVRLGTVVI